MSKNKERVRALNDELRRSHTGGLVMLTAGIRALGPDLLRKIDHAISSFNTFAPDNDPYEEHDFGSVMVGRQVVFFKIDYYDLDLRYASPDPSDPAVTRRVMTIMLAEEY